MALMLKRASGMKWKSGGRKSGNTCSCDLALEKGENILNGYRFVLPYFLITLFNLECFSNLRFAIISLLLPSESVKIRTYKVFR